MEIRNGELASFVSKGLEPGLGHLVPVALADPALKRPMVQPLRTKSPLAAKSFQLLLLAIQYTNLPTAFSLIGQFLIPYARANSMIKKRENQVSLATAQRPTHMKVHKQLQNNVQTQSNKNISNIDLPDWKCS